MTAPSKERVEEIRKLLSSAAPWQNFAMARELLAALDAVTAERDALRPAPPWPSRTRRATGLRDRPWPGSPRCRPTAQPDTLANRLEIRTEELDAARKDAESARRMYKRILDAEAPPLRWTSTPPTEPGPFFCRGPSQWRDAEPGKIDTECGWVRQTAAPGVLRFDSEWINGTIGTSDPADPDVDLGDGSYEWCPIPPPAEPSPSSPEGV